jgi:hypothetical protein
MGNVIIQVVLMKINKISLQQFLRLSEAEIQGLLHPAEDNLGHFLAWFQSLQEPSTQSESPHALIPLAPNSHVSLKVCTQLRTEFFIFRSGLTVTGLVMFYCTFRYNKLKRAKFIRKILHFLLHSL